MIARPRDTTDLYLAPVALELDRRLEKLSGLSERRLDVEVGFATDQQPRDVGDRRALMLATLTHLLPAHGWVVSWHPRGLRLSHERHQVVLGVPDSVRAYLGA
jgi:hypothetical protein